MEFGILGPLTVWEDGQELELGAAKHRALLAILLLHAGETMTTERLVDALWDEQPPATAVKVLHVYVSQLRKKLGDGVLETRPLGYVLCVEEGALDLHRFERLLRDGRRLLANGDAAEAEKTLREALSLWRGPALADFRYHTFARNEIGRLEELRLVALEERLEADLALGREAEAVAELEPLVRDHPLRENLRRLLILALYRSGRQADALAVYHDARTTLRDELGLEPGLALQQLEKAILQHNPSLDSSVEPSSPRARRPRPPRLATPARTTADTDGSIEQRKTVTVLSCAVNADAFVAGRPDPEAIQDVMSRFFEFAAETIESHGGTVEMLIGDEVMAVFGVPVVHEDDTLRAARAAVELRKGVRALGTDLGSADLIQVRIGVNTGQVVAGDPAEGRNYLTGDGISGGKQLQQRAAAGEVLLGKEAHALIAHAVVAEPLELPSSKGRDDVLAFRLESIHPAATALPHRADAALVGRERELDCLRGLFGEVAAGAGARQLTLVGEPGIGKSRLVRAFLAEVEAKATILIGRCPPYGEGITFWPLRELLTQAGHDETELAGSSHEVFAATRRILVDLSGKRPLVVVFDDVHWAEPTFLDFVEYLAARLGDARTLLLCLARPQLADLRPTWLQEPAAAMVLQPLSEADSLKLIEELGVAAPLRPRIAESAEGNPLFVEQLAAIAGEHGGAKGMPGSIRGVLHERLDRLGRKERALLERAAVAGRTFSLETVLDLTPEDERESVQARLLSLTRTRFVRPDPAAADEGFRFHHALIRDAAYDGIPKHTRADLHERVAARLEAQAAENALVGYHLEQAYRFRLELGHSDPGLGRRAGRLLRAAGKEAFGRADLPATISLLDRARMLIPPDEAARLLPRLGQALFESGRFAEAEATLEEGIERAGADSVLRSRGRVEQQFVRLQADPENAIAEAFDVAAAALRDFEEHDDDLGQCRAWRLRAWLEWTRGHATGADAAWQRAAIHAKAAGETGEFHDILGWRASASVEGPTPVPEAIRVCEQIREQVLGSPVAVAVTLHPLAALYAMEGDFERARSLIREANAILDDVGRMHSTVSHHEALVATLAGDPAEAEEWMLPGFRKLEEMGEKALLATTAAMLGRALYSQERYDEAERYCDVSESTAATADLVTQVIWRGVRAKLLARAGRVEEGEVLARHAVRLVAQTDLLSHHADALLDLGEVLQLGRQPEEADRAIRGAAGLYERKGNSVSAARARSLVSTLAAN